MNETILCTTNEFRLQNAVSKSGIRKPSVKIQRQLCKGSEMHTGGMASHIKMSHSV